MATFPRPIRYLMARDKAHLTAVLSIVTRTIFAYQRRLARADGHRDVLGGGVSFVQHFGSALNLNVHTHGIFFDGVFIDTPPEEPTTFLELTSVTQADVAMLLGRMIRRVNRYVATLTDGCEWDGDAAIASDDMALATAQQYAASVGAPRSVAHRHLGNADHASNAIASRDLCASADGFSLHAGVTLQANDRDGLLRLISYGARQSFSQQRLTQLPDGRLHYALARPWGNCRAITLEPVAFLHRLAALLPTPYLHLVRYHGVLAPNAARRSDVIPAAFATPKRHHACPTNSDDDQENDWLDMLPPPVPHTIPWAELLGCLIHSRCNPWCPVFDRMEGERPVNSALITENLKSARLPHVATANRTRTA